MRTNSGLHAMWPQQIKMTANLLEIIHHEDEFIIINKPSGLLAVPGRGPANLDSISHRVKIRFPGCISHPAVHRLDMDTSGLMILALTQRAHRTLSIQFEKRQVAKRYIALLDGKIDGIEGKVELPFRLDPANRPHQIYDAVNGKTGVTFWRKLADEPPYTRVEFIPVTGRTHQLRLHSAHELGLGIPIVNDPLYGNGKSHGTMKLHAEYLQFSHPDTNDPLEFFSSVPF